MWRVRTGIAHPNPSTYPEASLLLTREDIHRRNLSTIVRTDKASGVLVVVVGWDDSRYRCSPDGANDR